jgi:hypothetical protein
MNQKSLKLGKKNIDWEYLEFRIFYVLLHYI